MPDGFVALCQVTLVGYAAMGGVFWAFSDIVMRSLAHTDADADAAITVIQSINRTILRAAFMVVFIGLVPVSVVIGIYGVVALDGSMAWLVGGAATLYLIGVFGLTAVWNVPLNNRLQPLDPTAADAAAFWRQSYLRRWTAGNSVRAVASLAAAVCLLLALTGLAGV